MKGGEYEMNTIELNKLVPDPYQPRQVFDPIEMDLLKKSVQTKGILVPLIVEKYENGKYLVVDGERRFRVATELKLKNVPVEICDPMSPSDRMVMRFHLQDQHASWSPFDRARAISFFKNEQKLDNIQTGELLGLNPNTVKHWVSILLLSKRSQEIAINKRLPFSYLEKIARLTQLYLEISKDGNEKIESKLIEKLDRKELSNNQHFSILLRLFSKGEADKSLLKFLDNRQTIKQFMLNSEQGNSVEIDNLCYRARSLTSSIIKALKRKVNKDLNQSQTDKLMDLRNVIAQFIK